MLREFRDFISKGNLVELAVAFILGLAFAAVVTAFTTVVLSVIAAIFGANLAFDQLDAHIGETPIPIGAFVTALVNFVIIAFILFLIVRAYNRFRRTGEATTRPCPYCASDIPKAATRCPACTSDVALPA
jgi:large conductance mechanosensitive channel